MPGQGGLACCDSWGHKESDRTERVILTELNWCLWKCTVGVNFIALHLRAQTQSLCPLQYSFLQYSFSFLTGRRKNNDIPFLYCTVFSLFLYTELEKIGVGAMSTSILLNSLHFGQRKTIHLVWTEGKCSYIYLW